LKLICNSSKQNKQTNSGKNQFEHWKKNLKQNVNNNKQTLILRKKKENFEAEMQQANKQRTAEENCKAATASSYWIFQLHLQIYKEMGEVMRRVMQARALLLLC
jgi:hypothetical protein